jgi:hypothetical protein
MDTDGDYWRWHRNHLLGVGRFSWYLQRRDSKAHSWVCKIIQGD